MAELDREALIRALEKLGSEDDGEALQAARSVAAQLADADAAWDDLLVPDADADAEAEPPPGTREAAGDYAADLAIIEKLLGRPQLYEGTREELEAYRADIADGEFDENDRRYLHALDARLSKLSK